MKNLFIVLFFVSCTKANIESPASSNTFGTHALATANHIGDPNKFPDLYIPVAETGWDDYLVYGIGQEFLRVYYTNGIKKLKYDCPIANGAAFDYTGAHDFVVCRPCDGIPIEGTYGDYNYPGMLSIKTYKNGVRDYNVIKSSFNVYNTDFKIGWDYLRAPVYGLDTMWISAGAGDKYYNSVVVAEGLYAIVVEVNPETNGVRPITESNYQNNVTVLGVNLTGDIVVRDPSAIPANRPIPIVGLSYQYINQGNPKKVILSFNAHGEEVKVYRDGVFVGESYTTTYSDNLPPQWRQSTYTLIKVVDGLGESTPVSIVAKK